MEKNISTGLKVWLWIVMVLNGISAVQKVFKIANAPLSTIFTIVIEALMIYACVLIMFQMKIFGFKLMCIAAIVNAVVRVIVVVFTGLAAGAVGGSAAAGLVSGLVGAVVVVIIAAICPLITYLLVKENWNMFE